MSQKQEPHVITVRGHGSIGVGDPYDELTFRSNLYPGVVLRQLASVVDADHLERFIESELKYTITHSFSLCVDDEVKFRVAERHGVRHFFSRHSIPPNWRATVQATEIQRRTQYILAKRREQARKKAKEDALILKGVEEKKIFDTFPIYSSFVYLGVEMVVLNHYYSSYQVRESHSYLNCEHKVSGVREFSQKRFNMEQAAIIAKKIKREEALSQELDDLLKSR